MNFKPFSAGIFFLLLILPVSVFASSHTNYVFLIGIPGVTEGDLSFGSYLNALYALSISVAALVAVIKIIIAGLKYMLSDVVTSKQEAISDIRGSLLGLLVVISAVLVLTQINPQLVTTNIVLDPVQAPATYVPDPGTGGGGTAPGSTRLPLPQELDCYPLSNNQFNCDSEVNRCKSATPPGVPVPSTPTIENESIMCEFGNKSEYPPCLSEAACTIDRDNCISRGGTAYNVRINVSASEIHCVTPY